MRNTPSDGPSSSPTNNPSPEVSRSDTNEENNRMNMSGPSMRPAPRREKKLTDEQIKAQEKAAERSHQLMNQMLTTYNQRQNWITKPNMMKRVERTLASDPQLRNTLFTLAKGGAIAFTSLDARSQMRVLHDVRGMINQQARDAINFAARKNFIPDPTDVLNPYNQANPDSLVNQQQAMQQGVINTENAIATQMILDQDNATTAMEQQQEVETENNHTMQLTGTEQTDIEAYKAEMYSTVPTLSPESGRKDSEENESELEHHAKKEVEHHGEEKALHSFMNHDREGMIEGLKGKAMEKGEHEVLEHVGMAAAKILTAGG